MRFSAILVQWPVHSKIIHVSKKVKVKSLSCVRLFATPWTVAHKAPPSMGFSRQEYWSGLPFPSPGDLPHTGIKPRSPTLQVDALTSEPPGKPGHTLAPLKRLSTCFPCKKTLPMPQSPTYRKWGVKWMFFEKSLKFFIVLGFIIVLCCYY